MQQKIVLHKALENTVLYKIKRGSLSKTSLTSNFPSSTLMTSRKQLKNKLYTITLYNVAISNELLFTF